MNLPQLYEAWKKDVIGLLTDIISLEDENKRIKQFFTDSRRRKLLGEFAMKITGLRNGMISTEKTFANFHKHLKPYKSIIRSPDVTQREKYFLSCEDQILGLVNDKFLIDTIKRLYQDYMTLPEKNVIWDYLNAFVDMMDVYDNIKEKK